MNIMNMKGRGKSMAQYVLSVPDMSCHHCVKRISEALNGLGISEFKIDLENKEISVNTDNLGSVINVLDEVGYKATLKD